MKKYSYILSQHVATQDLAKTDLGRCPEDLLDEVSALIRQHLKRLQDNCNHPYNGIAIVRLKIAATATKIRQALEE